MVRVENREDIFLVATEDRLQMKSPKAVPLNRRNKIISKLTNDHILIKDV